MADNTNIMTAGPRGPALLQDIWLIEKMAHFDREVIPERRMHAKGWGAYGTFTVTHDITRYTRAKIFNEIGKQTPMFVRFSTVAGERGAADAERDIRGTRAEVLHRGRQLGHRRQQHAGVLLPRPAALPGPQPRDQARPAHRPAQRRQQLGLLVAAARGAAPGDDRDVRPWHPEKLPPHAPVRQPYLLMINAANERVWVKFHFRTQQGIANLTDAEAAALVANDRESHGRDLLNAIDGGDFPRWTMFIQVMTEAQAKTHKHNPFDLTKVWPKQDYPLIEVGVMELNRYPDNYFAEVEQAAFSPANIVPGIGFSPDKVLQARLFSYGDTQRYRLGINFNHIPVNAPKCPFQSYHRDGQMRTDGNLGGTLSFHPNSAGPVGEPARFRRAADAGGRRRGALGPSRGRRPLGAAGQPVPLDDSGAAAGAVREHRPRDG